MTAKYFYEGCHGKWKIFVLYQTSYLRTIRFQPSTFQCSVQGTFHTNMHSSHFYLFKAFGNCFHTLISKGGSNTSFGLIKGKCIFLLPIFKSFSLWPPFPSPMLLACPVVPQTQETREVCVSILLPNQYAQILLIYCKSSSHSHQVWYQAQIILT